MRMNRNEQRCYLTPEIEVNEVEVERGFSLSTTQQLPNYKEDGDIIIIG